MHNYTNSEIDKLIQQAKGKYSEAIPRSRYPKLHDALYGSNPAPANRLIKMILSLFKKTKTCGCKDYEWGS